MRRAVDLREHREYRSELGGDVVQVCFEPRAIARRLLFADQIAVGDRSRDR